MARLFVHGMDFYPRPPRGGRQNSQSNNRCSTGFLSTPSARRATRWHKQTPDAPNDFYPRPPRGGRQNSQSNNRCSTGFLSTPSARRATRWHKQTPDAPNDFYPRPPRGGRRGRMQRRVRRAGISIHALREEGDYLFSKSPKYSSIISIHALREEGDGKRAGQSSSLKNFYPRPPRGGRPS